MRVISRVLFSLAIVLALANCGQKGPLYFSDAPPPGMKPPKTQTYKPVPYPKEETPKDTAKDAQRDGTVEK